MTRNLIALVLVLTVVAVACGDSAPTAVPATTEVSGATSTAPVRVATSAPAAPTAPTDLTDLTVKPVIEVPAEDPPADLVVIDLVVGDGEEAVAGSLVSVHYVGVRYSDGGEFDASWNRGQAFDFELGAGRVIAGWDRGVAGMRVGGRRQLIIPAELGYGVRGAGSEIPPDAALIFVVDLLEIVPPFPAPSAISDDMIVIANQGGAFEGHMAWSGDGEGGGLFAGDNLTPDFPNDDGLQILLAFRLADIAEIASGRSIAEARLTSRAMQIAGAPFEDLGPFMAAPVNYTTFPPTSKELDPIGEAVACAADVEARFLTCDVTVALAQAVEDGVERINFRLRHERASDGDGEPDLTVFAFTDPNLNERGIFLLEIEFSDEEG